ncbi:MAG: DUF104 domain-containing protein [Caldilineales bacterium]|nr:DUF104 domain-containing protein [Caldilineales bacterium]
MDQVLKVIYRNGVLTPVQPLDMPENQHLEITLHLPERAMPPVNGHTLASEMLRIGRECAALPLLDGRTPEAILGYDDIGVPQS